MGESHIICKVDPHTHGHGRILDLEVPEVSRDYRIFKIKGRPVNRFSNREMAIYQIICIIDPDKPAPGGIYRFGISNRLQSLTIVDCGGEKDLR